MLNIEINCTDDIMEAGYYQKGVTGLIKNTKIS